MKAYSEDLRKQILEADVEDRPATTLKERCRFLGEAVGVSLSESTLSRLLRKMGFVPRDGV
ncbi:MAG TPA: winged helix-turn-helix domain-containing protein [Rubrobacteraceae bacterium]|nr:winged helix-turn-helix domain-containing protein [Rubrobacteraceae bacterium]